MARYLIIVAGCLLIHAFVFTPAAAAIRVPGDAPNIQAGIAAASEGDTLLLVAALYTGEGNRDLDYLGKAIVLRSAAGDPETCVIDCQGSSGDPHWGILFVDGEPASARVEGLTIRNAYGLVGGMACAGASPTISDCIFENNVREGLGGGVACTSNAAATFRRCRFLGNRSMGGGGAWCQHESSTFADCVFSDNEAEVGGGMASQGSDFTMIGCTFTNNRAQDHGGGLSCLYGDVVITATLFNDNLVTDGFGGGAALQEMDACAVLDCEFLGNEAVGGGGLHITRNVEIASSVIAYNTASAIAGGVAAGGANLQFIACTLAANGAPTAGGLYLFPETTAGFQGSIIAFSGEGEAVFLGAGASVQFACSDLFGNAGGDWTSAIAGQLGTYGNFQADPQFCDLAEEDLHLRNDSPCAPGNHPDELSCGVIGALAEGCDYTAVRPTSWSAVKALY